MAKKRNVKFKIELPIDEIVKMYLDDLMPVTEIAKHFNVNHGTITKRLKKECIKMRTRSENQKIAMNKESAKLNVSIASKASAEKRKETNLERYGSITPMGNVDIQKRIKENRSDDYFEKRQKKIEETNMKKYGVKNVMHVNEFKKKVQKVRWLDKSEEEINEIKEKIKNTFIKNYGVVNPMMNDIIKEKVRKSRWLDKSEEELKTIQEKTRLTIINRYGVDYTSEDSDIANSIGRTHATNFVKNKLSKYLDKFELEIVVPDGKTINDIWINSFNKYEFKCMKCNNNFKQIWNYIIRGNYRCPICYPVKNMPSLNPKAEKEIFNFLIEFCNLKEDEIIVQDKSQINPYQLDIYIPKLNIGIEHNGLYWHSDAHRPNDYHNMKYNLCLEKGIKLIQIFEDRWVDNNENIKNKLFNEITGMKYVEWIDENDIYDIIELDGYDEIEDLICLGFKYDSDIIGKVEFKFLEVNDKVNVEIIKNECFRYLEFKYILEYFKECYQWDKIIINDNLLWSDNELYLECGFNKTDFIEPYYINVRGNKRFNEEDLNEETRYDKIFNAGFDVYEMNKI